VHDDGDGDDDDDDDGKDADDAAAGPRQTPPAAAGAGAASATSGVIAPSGDVACACDGTGHCKVAYDGKSIDLQQGAGSTYVVRGVTVVAGGRCVARPAGLPGKDAVTPPASVAPDNHPPGTPGPNTIIDDSHNVINGDNIDGDLVTGGGVADAGMAAVHQDPAPPTTDVGTTKPSADAGQANPPAPVPTTPPASLPTDPGAEITQTVEGVGAVRCRCASDGQCLIQYADKTLNLHQGKGSKYILHGTIVVESGVCVFKPAP
jgi:hypothetical protein